MMFNEVWYLKDEKVRPKLTLVWFRMWFLRFGLKNEQLFLNSFSKNKVIRKDAKQHAAQRLMLCTYLFFRQFL